MSEIKWVTRELSERERVGGGAKWLTRELGSGQPIGDVRPDPIRGIPSHGPGTRVELPVDDLAAGQIVGNKAYVEWLDVDPITSTIISSAAEVTTYTFPIPGGLLQSQGAISCELCGKMLNDTGSDKTLTLRVKYGATTMYEDTATVAASAVSRGYDMEFFVANAGATNSQVLAGTIFFSTAVAPTTGYGAFGQTPAGTPFGGTAAEDSTATKNLAVSFQWNAASSSLSFDQKFAHLSRIAF